MNIQKNPFSINKPIKENYLETLFKKIKNKMKDIMLDLETLGNKENPVIIQLSAIQFDIKTGEIGKIFNYLINPMSCKTEGLEVSKSTVEWWLSQNTELVKEVLGKSIIEGLNLKEVLNRFSNYLEIIRANEGSLNVWGNGILSDNLWIQSAYKACNINPSIYYNEHKDVRTLVDLSRNLLIVDVKKEIVFAGNQHNALDNCKHQIKYCSEIYKLLQIK
jgi:exodeoxyribonuclease VIII